MPEIASAVAAGDHASAAAAVLAFHDAAGEAADGGAPSDDAAAGLAAHPAAAAFGPFRYEPAWLLARQEAILASGTLDGRLEATRHFLQLFTGLALRLGAPARALPVVAALGDGYVTVGDTRGGHLEFNAVCVLAALGRLDEAMARARSLVRHGYRLRWRFDLAVAARMAWTQTSGQNRWLAPLAATAAYQRFLADEVRHEPLPRDDAGRIALCAAHDGVLGGRTRKRCWLSGELIRPGEPIVRTRRLHGYAGDGRFDVAAAPAFHASPWAEARQRLYADAIPIGGLFPLPRHLAHGTWRTPAIAAFHHDVAHDSRASISTAHWRSSPITRRTGFDGAGCAARATTRPGSRRTSTTTTTATR